MTADPGSRPVPVPAPADAGPLLDVAIEVLRAKEPPSGIPAWLRRLRGFEPRRLRSGQAARDLLRGVAEVEAFRTAVFAVVSERQADVIERLRAAGRAGVDDWLRDGGDAAALATLAWVLDGDTGAYAAGRASAAAEVARLEKALAQARASSDTAATEAAARLERVRADAVAAKDSKAEAEDRAARAQADAKRLRALERQLEAAKAEVAAAVAARTEAEGGEDRARQQLQETEQQRAGLERAVRAAERRVAQLERQVQAAGSGLAAEAKGALVQAAAALEEAATTIRRVVEPRPEPGGDDGSRRQPRKPAPPERRRPTVPKGLHPDSADGLMAMLRGGAVLLVDGYNVAYDRRGIADRDALIETLAALLRAASARGIAYFDGVEASRRRKGRLAVVFTEEAIEADDAILADVAALAPEQAAVVASSDKRVATGAAALGAEVVSSATLLDALRARRG